MVRLNVLYTYSSTGIQSRSPVAVVTMFLWVNNTPFGIPVEPLVYMITAKSLGAGGSGLETGEKKKSFILWKF